MTYGGLEASWGKAFKYFDIKWTFILSLSIFEIGSLICGVAPTSKALIIGRSEYNSQKQFCISSTANIIFS